MYNLDSSQKKVFSFILDNGEISENVALSIIPLLEQSLVDRIAALDDDEDRMEILLLVDDAVEKHGGWNNLGCNK